MKINEVIQVYNVGKIYRDSNGKEWRLKTTASGKFTLFSIKGYGSIEMAYWLSELLDIEFEEIEEEI